ncbi:OTU domain, ubiquitin aldehyde binding [Savitreella phatthalungensis]
MGLDDGDVMDDRPSDEAILAHRLAVESDATSSQPLLSARAPLSSLLDDYKHDPIVIRKIESLISDSPFTHIYRTRGDGNCFYRAYLAGLSLWSSSCGTTSSATAALRSTGMKILGDAGFSEIVYEDFVECLVCAVKEGVEAVRDVETSNGGVCGLRLLASAVVREDPAHYAGFAGVDVGAVGAFVEREIEAFGAEADHLPIAALTKALVLLHLPTPNILTLDRTTQRSTYTPKQDRPSVTLLYRPGHYDLLV